MVNGLLSRSLLRALWAVAALVWSSSSAGYTTPNCDRADTRTEEAVYECMMTYRYSDPRGNEGRSPFENRSSSCAATLSTYAAALRHAGVAPMLGKNVREQGLRMTPDCAVVARALTRINGVPPRWAGCLDYPGRFDARHMKRCLESYTTEFTQNGPNRMQTGGLWKLQGCKDAIDTYERAILSATHTLDIPKNDYKHRMERTSPAGFERPDCEVVAMAGVIQPDGRPLRRPPPQREPTTTR